jgi:hypothetical protein
MCLSRFLEKIHGRKMNGGCIDAVEGRRILL